MLKHNFELGARRRDLHWPVVVMNVVAIAVLVAAVMPKISRHSEVVWLLIGALIPIVLTVVVCICGRFRKVAIVANAVLLVGAAVFMVSNGMDDPFSSGRMQRRALRYFERYGNYGDYGNPATFFWIALCVIVSAAFNALFLSNKLSFVGRISDTGASSANDERSSKTLSKEQTDVLYERAWGELNGGKLESGLWARLLAENNGNEEQTKGSYLKERVKQLQESAKTGETPATSPSTSQSSAVPTSDTPSAQPTKSGMLPTGREWFAGFVALIVFLVISVVVIVVGVKLDAPLFVPVLIILIGGVWVAKLVYARLRNKSGSTTSASHKPPPSQPPSPPKHQTSVSSGTSSLTPEVRRRISVKASNTKSITEKSIADLLPRAEAGDTVAQFKMGLLLRKIDREEEAVMWLKKSSAPKK